VPVALRRPRLLLVLALAALVAYVPDVAAAGMPLPAVDLVLLAPAAVIIARRLLGEEHVAVPSEAAAFLALLAVTTASALLATEPAIAVAAIRQTAEYALLVIAMLVLLDRPSWLRRACWAVVLAASLLAALAVVQQVTRTYESDYFGLAGVMEDHGLQRAAGPLDPNFFAMVLLASGALALYLGLSATTRSARLVAGATLGMLLAGAVTTSSRGGSIALAVALLAILVLRRVPLWAVAVVVTGTLMAAVLFLPAGVKERFGHLTPAGEAAVVEQPSDPSVANRYAENVVALKMFRDHPLLGVGPANYSPRYVAYAQRLGFDTGYAGGPYRAHEQEAHNLYLETLAESGVLGGLVLFGTFALALLAAWRARARLPRREALLAEGMFVALLVVLTASIFLHNAYPRYPWIFVGLALAAGRLAGGPQAKHAKRPVAPAAAQPVVAYVMSRFPKISETFILNEILVLERLGVRVEVFPLLSEHEDVRHPEADRLVARAHHAPLLSLKVLGAQAAWLAEAPSRYLRTWWRTLRGSARSREAFLRAFYVVPLAAAYAREMRAAGVARVHAHYATYPALAALVVRELTGIPYGFTAHAHDIYVDRTMLAEKLRGADLVVTVSEYNRCLLRELYGPAAEHVEVVRCGVDPGFFAPRGSARAGAPLTILSVASLEPYKGHADLLCACTLLAARGVAFRLLLVGDGVERARLEALGRDLGLGDAVMFLGRRPRSAVRQLLAEADVFALASVTTASGKKEGIPVALMEALASGVPAVATDVSGVHELVIDGTTGLLVPERRPLALADALETLARDPALCERLGRAGRARVLEEYDLTRNVRRLHALMAAATRWPAPAPEATP
jgi:colanic acid/amylovoran biosynthesis glycosyltransferase